MNDFYIAVKQKVEAQYKQADVEKFEKAARFAAKAHEGQVRLSGEPYIMHPLNAANILIDLGMDIDTLVAALLHDVIEDTSYTQQEIKDEFGEDVEMLVEGVTKISKLQFNSIEEHQAENLRKMLLAMAQDIRVILIKLADRLHNMRTLNAKDEAKQRSIATETMEIYAPLANRLGLFSIKSELQNLAFKYLHHEAYDGLESNVKLLKREWEEFINQMIGILKQKLEENHIKAQITGRQKHFYSIYQKMTLKNKTLDEIFDLVAIRVIVDNIRDCYEVLGIVHTLWRPLPGRFKDYIAMPKANMYQSLHTTVFGAKTKPFEIQIRTREMHMIAEYGIAAHWKYKEGVKDSNQRFEEKLSWLRRIIEWEGELKDSKEFVDSLKVDVFSDEVFVFTPKGEIISLPIGSTPLDYAYSIHSEIGHKCIGAKVNGKIIPISTPLKTGNIVEIITTSAPHGPSRDWLNIVKTSQAKNKIRQWFKREMRQENIDKGKDILDKESKRLGYQWSQLSKQEWCEVIFERYTLNSMDDLYASVGYGGISSAQVIPRLVEEYKKENKLDRSAAKAEQRARKPHKAEGVSVKGHSNMLVRYAHCCNPVPGDDIIGYITKGRGVSVHRKDCVNIAGLDKAREIEVSWENTENAAYHTEILVEAYDRVGLFVSLTNLLAEKKVNILAVNAHTNKNGVAQILFTIEITSADQLNKIITQIKGLPEIIDTRRVNF